MKLIELSVPWIVLLTAAGCGAAPAGDSLAPTTRAADPRFLVSARAEGNDMAQVIGVVGRSDAGCLVLDLGTTGQNPIVWPQGSSPLVADGALEGARLPDGVEVRVGQYLDGGGGYSSLRDVELFSGEPERCGFGEDEEFAFLSESPVRVSASPTS